MREIIAAIVFFVTVLAVIRYAMMIRAKKARPSIITWGLFLVGATVSLLTSMTDPNYDLVSNATNGADIILTGTVAAFLIIHGGKEQWHFEWLDLTCLFLAISVLVYWAGHRTVYSEAHAATQAIFIVAYWPTGKRLWFSQVNTEDFWYWTAGCSASALGFGLAITGGGTWMPAIYTGRSVISSIIIILLMLRLKRKWGAALW